MNLLDAEPLIVARLKAQLPEVKTIASAATIAGVVDIANLLDGVFVQPGPADVVSSAGNGIAQAEEEIWLVVAVTPLLPDTDTLAGDYQAMGALLGKIAEALAGWQPSSAYRPMRYLGREDPLVEAGQAEFPLRFSVRRIFSGTGG